MNPALAENQFSLARWWAQGDPISHAVAYVLLVMSLASWFFIFSKAFTLWRVRRAAPAIDAFWDAPDVSDGLALLRAADVLKFLQSKQTGADFPESLVQRHLATRPPGEALFDLIQLSRNDRFDVERKFRETRMFQVAPVNNNLIKAFVATKVLGLPRSY